MPDFIPGDPVRTVTNALGDLADKVTSIFRGEEHPFLITAEKVDPNRYAGLWYELARLPMRFQADASVSTAEYGVVDDHTISVHNTAYQGAEVDAEITGTATPAEGAETSFSRLKVGFGGILRFIPVADEGNYWIMAVTDDYGMALVGTPDRDALWLLSRDPGGWDSEQAQRFVALAADQGFDTTRLLVADWDTRYTRTEH